MYDVMYKYVYRKFYICSWLLAGYSTEGGATARQYRWSECNCHSQLWQVSIKYPGMKGVTHSKFLTNGFAYLA